MSDVRPIARAGSAAARPASIGVARSISVAAWVWVLVVAYGELLPLEFAPAASGGRVFAREGIGWSGADPADVLTNIAIFVPVGLLLTMHFARGARSWFGPTISALVCGGALATLLEMAQAHLPVRVSSAGDVLNNVLGLGFGAMIAPLVHARGGAWRDALALRVAVCPQHVLWCGAGAALLGVVLWQALDLVPRFSGGAASLAAAFGGADAPLRWRPPFVAAFFRPVQLAVIDLVVVFGQFALITVGAWLSLGDRDTRLRRIAVSSGVVAWAALLAVCAAPEQGGCVDLTGVAIAATAGPLTIITIHFWGELGRRGRGILAATHSVHST
jgi:hypothetical protein